MKCPECKKSESEVIESRELYDGELIRRRRECLKCQMRFTTYERIEQPVIMVIKRDGKREQFSRNKIANGVYRACEKRNIPETEVEEVVSSIEKKIRARGENEISSIEIGEQVLKELSGLDDVSYIRFASVYQSFIDINSFHEIIKNMKKKDKGSENE